MIGYAWPRRPDEILWDPNKPSSWVPKDDTVDDRAIIERYFADALPPLQQFERRWMLLGRDGCIWATGSGLYRSEQTLLSEIEARFPGIKVSTLWNEPVRGSNCLGATDADRHALRVSCVWLLPDSPVTEITSLDFSRRPDVLPGRLAIVEANRVRFRPPLP
jgi:hypothetical protein